MRRAVAGPALWTCCLQYFVAEAICATAWPGHYSFRHNFISDLGATDCAPRMLEAGTPGPLLCSPLHAVMNGSFILQGLLIAGGTCLVWPLFPRGVIWRTGLLFVGVSGPGVFLVGLAPENAMPGLHYLGAAENLLCCNIGMAIMGLAMLLAARSMWMIGALSLAAGLLGLCAAGLLTAHMDLGLGPGGMERVTAYPFPLWIASMGLRLLRRGAPA